MPAADQASAATRRRHAAPPCLYPQVAAPTAACYAQRRRGTATAWAGIRADAIRKLCCQQIGFIQNKCKCSYSHVQTSQAISN